ncbi:MAG: 6-phosphogluconolactonase [Candidatus Pacebacteria bacterium]|nr:6-phosphogluconolactonase [Candidatus Paceibacterota bacterium]
MKGISQKISGLIKGPEPVLFMISGGSSLSVLDHVDIGSLGSHLTISVIDERFSTDPKVNNFCQLEQTKFFDRCIKKDVEITGTRIHKGESLPKAVMDFKKNIYKWKKERGGKVVALLGIGKDGHTAGVMPYPENEKLFKDLFLDEEWVVSYDAKEKNEFPLRFTVTLTFLKKEVDHGIVFAKGKKEALKLLNDKNKKIHEVPAKILKEMRDIHMFTE